MQERSEHSPAGVEFIITDEVRVVTLESIQDERLVGLGDLQIGEATAVGEIKLGDHGLHGQTRQLRVHLDVNRFVGLDTDDQLVAGDVLEDSGGHILELNTNLGLLLVQG